MTLEYLKYFIAACDCGSIQSAAKLLFVSAQGVGKGIQRLEQSLGIALLERTQSGVKPTEFGRLYYEQAKVVERELQKLDFIAAHGGNKNSIKIGVLGRQKYFYLVSSCAQAFLKEHPNLKVDICTEVFDSSDELFDSIRRGTTDIGWLFHWREHEDLDYFYVSNYSPVYLIISKDHPLASQDSVSWDDISTLKYVTAGEHDPFSNLIKNLSIKNGFTPDIAFYTTENHLIANLVDNNAAAILMREVYYSAITNFCQNSCAIPLAPRLDIANSLFISKKRSLSAEKREFTEYMVNYFRKVMGIGRKFNSI